ncbi:5-oxoproline transporter, DUF979 family subunit, partial [Staphylococcus haemolyticus]|uniref:5-oxoproline transporter, DUF979 family subunit n=1 Tax=Staphylococcus haemolyticus TaxID=1283 RepID=UPI0011A6B579
VFRMVMGNGLGGFSVIRGSIGIRLVIGEGGDRMVGGGVGMSGGLCGRLVRGMGANLKRLGVGVVEMKEEFGVIKGEGGIGLGVIVIQMGVMYLWGF